MYSKELASNHWMKIGCGHQTNVVPACRAWRRFSTSRCSACAKGMDDQDLVAYREARWSRW